MASQLHRHFYDKDLSWLEAFKGCGRKGNIYAEFASGRHHKVYSFGTWYDIEHLADYYTKNLECGPHPNEWWIYICKDCAREIGLLW